MPARPANATSEAGAGIGVIEVVDHTRGGELAVERRVEIQGIELDAVDVEGVERDVVASVGAGDHEGL